MNTSLMSPFTLCGSGVNGSLSSVRSVLTMSCVASVKRSWPACAVAGASSGRRAMASAAPRSPRRGRMVGLGTAVPRFGRGRSAARTTRAQPRAGAILAGPNTEECGPSRSRQPSPARLRFWRWTAGGVDEEDGVHVDAGTAGGPGVGHLDRVRAWADDLLPDDTPMRGGERKSLHGRCGSAVDTDVGDAAVRVLRHRD